MDATPIHQHSGRRGFQKLLLALAGAALFLGVASVIKPAPQSASADPTWRVPPITNSIPTTVAAHPKGYKLLGILQGAEHMVRCWATPAGPRYSVHTLDGRLLQDDLPADEVYRAFPDVDLQNMRVDPPSGGGGGTPLMLVDPQHD